MNDEHLAHYGVLGMKWGVRKPESIARLKREGIRKKIKYDPYRIVGGVNDKVARNARDLLKTRRERRESTALRSTSPENVQKVLNQSSAHEARLKARKEALLSKAARTPSIARAAKLGQRISLIDEKISRESAKREAIIKKYGGKRLSIIERPGTVTYVDPKAIAKKGAIGVGATAVGAATAVASGGASTPLSVVTMATGTKIAYDAAVNGIKSVPASKYSAYSSIEFKEVENAFNDLGLSVSDIENAERR